MFNICSVLISLVFREFDVAQCMPLYVHIYIYIYIYIYVLGWVKSLATFCEAQFSSFTWGSEGDKLHWSVKCQDCLILSKCYSSNLAL